MVAFGQSRVLDRQKTMMRIGLITTLNTNIGDEIILAGMKNLLINSFILYETDGEF